MTDTRHVGPIDVETPPGAAAGMRTEPGPAQAARHSASRLGLEAKLDLRARLGLSFLVCTRSNSSQNAVQETALMATVQEMRRQPEQDDRECAAELRSVKEETSSVFTFNLRDDLPVFGDGDSDLDKHLESFQDVCLVVEPKNGREKLQSFARALKGTLRRCYDTIVKEAKLSTMETTRANPRWSLAGRSGHGCFLPRVKRSKGDEGQSLLRWPGKEECAFQDFQASWLEALTELNAAGAYKCQKDLLYDYLHNLRDEASGDRRFWPLRPTPVVKQALEAHHTSTEDAPPQGPKRAKGPTHTTQAQVALPSTGIGEKRKDCNNPGHITLLCPQSGGETWGIRGAPRGISAHRHSLQLMLRWASRTAPPAAIPWPLRTKTVLGAGHRRVRAKGGAVKAKAALAPTRSKPADFLLMVVVPTMTIASLLMSRRGRITSRKRLRGHSRPRKRRLQGIKRPKRRPKPLPAPISACTHHLRWQQCWRGGCCVRHCATGRRARLKVVEALAWRRKSTMNRRPLRPPRHRATCPDEDLVRWGIELV